MAKTAHIDVRVEPELIKRIDHWRAQHRPPSTRTAAIVHMIEEFLAASPLFELSRATRRD